VSLITESEMDDFDESILEAGFEVVGFNVFDLEDEPTAKDQAPTTGTVTVHRISNDEAITYNAGHLSTWVSKFKNDLHKGKYGEP